MQQPETARLVHQTERPRVYVYDYFGLQKGTRYLGRADPFRVARLPTGMTEAEATQIGERMYLTPPTAGIWGIDGSYDMDFAGLYTPEVDRFMRLLRATEQTPAHLRLLQMGGVSHVIALHDEGLEELAPAASFVGPFPEEIKISTVPDRAPRTYVVGSHRVCDEQQAFQVLASAGFDPTREVILSSGAAHQGPSNFEGSSRILSAHADQIRIEAQLSHPGHVVVVDGYDPGWRARVDGAEVPVLRANVGFRAVSVPPGKHIVELRYRPPAVFWGLAISGLALLVPVILRLAHRKK